MLSLALLFFSAASLAGARWAPGLVDIKHQFGGHTDLHHGRKLYADEAFGFEHASSPDLHYGSLFSRDFYEDLPFPQELHARDSYFEDNPLDERDLLFENDLLEERDSYADIPALTDLEVRDFFEETDSYASLPPLTDLEVRDLLEDKLLEKRESYAALPALFDLEVRDLLEDYLLLQRRSKKTFKDQKGPVSEAEKTSSKGKKGASDESVEERTPPLPHGKDPAKFHVWTRLDIRARHMNNHKADFSSWNRLVKEDIGGRHVDVVFGSPHGGVAQMRTCGLDTARNSFRKHPNGDGTHCGCDCGKFSPRPGDYFVYQGEYDPAIINVEARGKYLPLNVFQVHLNVPHVQSNFVHVL